MRYLRYLALLAALLIPAAYSQQAQAQVGFGVNIGAPPVCEYGFYSYYPYACAPYGYWGPEWFVDGIFIGVGPWYHFYYSHPWYRGYYGRFGWGGGWHHFNGVNNGWHRFNGNGFAGSHNYGYGGHAYGYGGGYSHYGNGYSHYNNGYARNYSGGYHGGGGYSGGYHSSGGFRSGGGGFHGSGGFHGGGHR